MLPTAACAWLSEHRGDVLGTTPLASTQGEVWRVDFVEAEPVIVKSGSVASIGREVQGLEAARERVPRVLARPAASVVVLSWHPGDPVASVDAVRAAGEWLKRLHAAPCECNDPLDPRDALLRRRDAWLARASGDLEVSRVEALDFAAFVGMHRVNCHRDFTPSNWLWDAEHGLTVVDFGQSRTDVALWDLVKLEAELFREQPHRRAVFYAAYGALDAEDEARLQTLLLLHGLQTAVWGDAHGVPAFSALGRAILAAETCQPESACPTATTSPNFRDSVRAAPS